MNVVLVARQSDRAPLCDDNDDNASTRERGFLREIRCFEGTFETTGERDCLGRLAPRGGRPVRPRIGENDGSRPGGVFEVKKLGSSSDESIYSSSSCS